MKRKDEEGNLGVRVGAVGGLKEKEVSPPPQGLENCAAVQSRNHQSGAEGGGGGGEPFDEQQRHGGGSKKIK